MLTLNYGREGGRELKDASMHKPKHVAMPLQAFLEFLLAGKQSSFPTKWKKGKIFIEDEYL